MKTIISLVGLTLLIIICQKIIFLFPNEKNTEIQNEATQFSIIRFFDNSRMEDSLLLIVDTGIGDSWHRETNIIKRENNRLTGYSFNEGEFVSAEEKVTKRTYVNFCETDTLCFDYLINNTKIVHKCNDKWARIKLIINNDTLYYCTNNKIATIKMSHLYRAIKHRMYPEMRLYKKVEIPK